MADSILSKPIIVIYFNGVKVEKRKDVYNYVQRETTFYTIWLL